MAGKKIRSWGESGPSVTGTLWKLGVLGTVDAIAVTMIMVLLAQELMMQAIISIVVLIFVNWIYLRKGGLPAKYLTPGVLFLIVFQIYVTYLAGIQPSQTTVPLTTVTRLLQSKPLIMRHTEL
jgi:arabinogalactan oligomer / maltooligosaccharide transport system permease protein